MILNWVLLLFILIEIGCFVAVAKSKDRSIGLMFLLLLFILCSAISILFLSNNGVVVVKKLFVAYYIFRAWILLGFLAYAISITRKYFCKQFIVPSTVICVCQSVIMLSILFGEKIILCSRKILFGENWWVASIGEYRNIFFSFELYGALCVVNAILVVMYVLVTFNKTTLLYKSRHVCVLLSVVAYFGLDGFTWFSQMPIWINVLLLLPIAIIMTYTCTIYKRRKLQDYSLTIFSNEMADGFAVYNERGELLYANDVIGKAFSEDDKKKFLNRNYMEEWISDTKEMEGNMIRLWEVDGKIVYYIINSQTLVDNGHTIGYIYIFHDDTKDMETIQKIEEANEELEHAAKMKSDFLANMSHEIRTPMNAVIGMTELALRETKDPAIVGYLYQIKASGRNLLNIINDILDFSKIEAGKLEIIPDDYEVLSEINDIANTLMTRIGEKNIELFVTASPNIPKVLHGDSMRIRQILINLANNAIKFTQQGMVHIIVDCDRISDDQIMLNFHVKDTGSGIKEEDLNKLFVSFQQVDSKRNRAIEGTGLGLAISKNLCQSMGGSIGVTSEYGVGSDFYFSIPQKVVTNEYELEIADSGNKRAILLDDNSLISDVFSENMSNLSINYSVIDSINDYSAMEGVRDYLYFDKKFYGADMEKFLSDNPSCTGIVLTGYGDIFNSEIPNLRIMQKPVTTLIFSTILNDREEIIRRIDEGDNNMDFIAPDAKILIVDDNQVNITVAVGLFEPLQMNITAANSGKEAIKLLEVSKYDIVFMDHMMPEMDGIEASEIIRRDMPHLKDMPIIALTANAMSGAKEMFLEHGMNDFVSKPIELKSVIAAIKKWLPAEKVIKRTEKVNEVQDEAIRVDGLNTETAISKLGTVKLYNTVLEDYYRVGNKKLEAIRNAYNQESWKEYTIEVHALKSASRQIGALELGAVAEKMEKAGNELDINAINANTNVMLDMYSELLGKLKEHFGSDEVDGVLPEIDIFDLQDYISQIMMAGSDNDLETINSIIEQMKGFSYPDNISDTVYKIYEAGDNSDVSKCVELCESFIEELMEM